MGDHQAQNPTPSPALKADHTGRNLAIFGGVVLLWILIDRVVKLLALPYPPGAELSSSLAGILHLELVHNRGAAWGMLADGTWLLIILSAAICVLLLVYLIWRRSQASVGEIIGLALVFAGGVGNLIDRVCYGFVVDLFALDFIDFPVFNIADIGVTCGFIILVISLIKEGFFSDPKGGR